MFVPNHLPPATAFIHPAPCPARIAESCPNQDQRVQPKLFLIGRTYPTAPFLQPDLILNSPASVKRATNSKRTMASSLVKAKTILSLSILKLYPDCGRQASATASKLARTSSGVLNLLRVFVLRGEHSSWLLLPTFALPGQRTGRLTVAIFKADVLYSRHTTE